MAYIQKTKKNAGIFTVWDSGWVSAGGFCLGLAALAVMAGCSGGTDDPAALQRLKDAGVIVLSDKGQAYLVNTSRQPLTAEAAENIAALPNLKNLDFTASELND